jgi:hypothetical protein
MSWDRTGQKVEATYLKEYTISGTVVLSRVKYGGTVQHTVELDTPLALFGTVRDRILVDEPELRNVTA